MTLTYDNAVRGNAVRYRMFLVFFPTYFQSVVYG